MVPIVHHVTAEFNDGSQRVALDPKKVKEAYHTQLNVGTAVLFGAAGAAIQQASANQVGNPAEDLGADVVMLRPGAPGKKAFLFFDLRGSSRVLPARLMLQIEDPRTGASDTVIVRVR